MYTVKITELEIVDGDQKIARIVYLGSGAISLKVIHGEPDWSALTKAITQAIQIIDAHED